MKSNADTAERTRRTIKLIDLPAHDSQFVDDEEEEEEGDVGEGSSLSGGIIRIDVEEVAFKEDSQ